MLELEIVLLYEYRIYFLTFILTKIIECPLGQKEGIVIEFKKLDPDDEENLEETAHIALKQIKDKNYAVTLKNRGIKNIKEIAIVFSGKEIYIKQAK